MQRSRSTDRPWLPAALLAAAALTAAPQGRAAEQLPPGAKVVRLALAAVLVSVN